MLARRMVPQLQQFVLGWGPERNLLTSYGLAGLIFFMVGTAVDSGGGLQEQLSGDHAVLPMAPATPSPDVEIPPLSADKAISDALAMHKNHQRIPLSVFMDLIRTMERSGFERSAAIYVVVELSKPPANGRWNGLFAWDEGCGGQACQENRSSRRMPRNGPCCMTCRNRSTAAKRTGHGRSC